MCGILGIFKIDGIDHSISSEKNLSLMLGGLVERGPDQQGLYISKSTILGHSRLSIIDPLNGTQPMQCLNNRFVITYNGEIFNYNELKDLLISHGIRFKTNCDTEVVLNAYIKFGVKCLDMFNGQFSFCIFDKRKKEFFLARDKIGILPLFYTNQKDHFFFSSNLKSLLVCNSISNEVNFNSLEQIAGFWSTIGENTFLKNIQSLEPGHYMKLSISGRTVQKYWDLNFNKSNFHLSFTKQKEILKDLIQNSIKVRLNSDVPLCSYLSGGLDSSIISSIASNICSQPLKTFSIRFTDIAFDESEFQNLISDYSQIENFFIKVNGHLIAENFENSIWHIEQPVYRTAPIPMLLLSRFVNDNNYKVTLTGEGADEIAWGYEIFKETLLRKNLKDSNDSKWVKELIEIYPYLKHYNKRNANQLVTFYKSFPYDDSDPISSHKIRLSQGKKFMKYLSADLQDNIFKCNRAEEELEDILPAEFYNFSSLQKTQYIEMKTFLQGYLLSSQGDRMLMANSVEGRYPFLDSKVINFFSSITPESKLNNNTEKYILKETFKDILPNKIINRQKYPYRAPEAKILIASKLAEKYLSETYTKDLVNIDLFKRLIKKIDQNSNSFSDDKCFILLLSFLSCYSNTISRYKNIKPINSFGSINIQYECSI